MKHESPRLAILMTIIVFCNVVDLYATLSNITNLGMVEYNPFAAWIISTGNLFLLSVYKISLVTLSMCCLWLARSYKHINYVAWFMTLVMVWLMWYWSEYSHQIAEIYELTGGRLIGT